MLLPVGAPPKALGVDSCCLAAPLKVLRRQGDLSTPPPATKMRATAVAGIPAARATMQLLASSDLFGLHLLTRLSALAKDAGLSEDGVEERSEHRHIFCFLCFRRRFGWSFSRI